MGTAYWSSWYSGWGWFLWFAIIILLFSNAGHWGYAYRVHRGYGLPPKKAALDILDERYARGEIARDEYTRMKAEIAGTAIAK